MKMCFTPSKPVSVSATSQSQLSKSSTVIKPSLRSSTNRFSLNNAHPKKGMSCGCGK